MAAVDVSYSCDSGATMRGGRFGLPAWLAGAALHEIVNISTASDTQGAALNAWGTLVLIDGTGTLVSPANGGHTDSSDNRVTSIDLLAASPSWTVQIAASASGDVVSDADYYADGKPNSRHGYTHAHYVAQRGRVMLFGGEGTYQSGGSTYVVDGHTVSGTWTWDAGSTYASLAAGRGYGQGVDPTTGNVWTNVGWLWNQSANTWSQPGTQQISAISPAIRSPWAYDGVAGKFFCLQWRDGRNLSLSGIQANLIDPSDGTVTAVTFNTSSAYTQWLADEHQYSALTYDSDLDCFYFYSGQTYDSSGVIVSQVPTRIYKITKGSPNWGMEILSVTGDTPSNVQGSVSGGGAGINGRFQYVPALKGVFCQPQQNVAPWFMRTS